MIKNLKTYKLQKTKQYLKSLDLIFFVHTINLNSKRWLDTEKEFFISNLSYYKINNSITKLALKNSVFKNFDILISGSMCLVLLTNNQKNKFQFKKNFKNNKRLPLVNLKLNKKMYSSKQFLNLTTLNYKNNIKIFNNTLNFFLKLSYKTFSK